MDYELLVCRAAGLPDAVNRNNRHVFVARSFFLRTTAREPSMDADFRERAMALFNGLVELLRNGALDGLIVEPPLGTEDGSNPLTPIAKTLPPATLALGHEICERAIADIAARIRMHPHESA